jgi:hypothetical protein
MTQISKSLIPFLIFFAFVSCDNSKKEPEKSKYEIRSEKQDKLDTLNLIEAQRLSQTTNSIIGWDTPENFTYSLQELFESGGKPVSFVGEIKDIIKKDSIYILKVMNTSSKSSKNFMAEISVTANMFQAMKLKLDPNETNEGCFIFKPTSIRSSSLLKIDSEVSTDEDAQTVDDANANASSELTYDSSNIIVFFKGDMINFYLYKRL